MVASTLGEMLELVERTGQARVEYRGRLVLADREGVRVRFQMADGLEGSVAAAWPEACRESPDGRARLLRALNGLVQRCGMFEVCDRAYQLSNTWRSA